MILQVRTEVSDLPVHRGPGGTILGGVGEDGRCLLAQFAVNLDQADVEVLEGGPVRSCWLPHGLSFR
jgi:hypothetical protein